MPEKESEVIKTPGEQQDRKFDGQGNFITERELEEERKRREEDPNWFREQK